MGKKGRCFLSYFPMKERMGGGMRGSQLVQHRALRLPSVQ